MPRVELARKSMPVDKFSIFNKRKGQSNTDEAPKDLKQARKEESQSKQGEVSFYGNADSQVLKTQEKPSPGSEVNYDGAVDTQASVVELKKNRFRYKDLDITERKKHTQNILNQFKRNVRKIQQDLQDSTSPS